MKIGWILSAFLLLLALGAGPIGIDAGLLPREPVTLWVLDGPESYPLIHAIGNLHDPSVRVLRFSYEELQQCVMAALGVGPKQQFCPAAADDFDVLLADDPWLPAIASKLAVLDPPPEAAGYFPRLLEVGAVPASRGRYVGYPWVGNCQLFCYNTKLYPGLTFKTWQQVLKAVGEFRNDRASAVALRAITSHAIVTDFIPILWAVSPNGLPVQPSAAGPFLGGSPDKAAMALLELGKRAPVGYMYFDDSDVGEFLWQGKAGLGVVWAAWAMQMANQHRSGGESHYRDLRFVPMPEGHTEMGVWYLTVHKFSKRLDDAVELVRRLSTPETLKHAAMGGNPPVRRDSLADPEFQNRYPFYSTLQEAIESARPRPRTAKWLEIEAELGKALVRLHLKPDQVAAIMQDAEKSIHTVFTK